MNIAIVTSGGDAPGMNAAIRSIVRIAHRRYRKNVIGFKNGFQGIVDPERYEPMHLTSTSVAEILSHGGTLLKTARLEGFAT